MKIAHITATFPPYWAGTGNVAYHNARILHDRGHDVTVFTAAPREGIHLPCPFPVQYLPVAFALGNAPLLPNLLPRLRGYDLIHLHYPYIFGAELAVAAAALYRRPLVLTYHNRLDEQHLVKRILFASYNRIVEPLVLRSATRLLAVREEHFQRAHPHLASDPRLREVPNGVDTDLFRPMPMADARQTLNIPRDAPVALYVGALDRAHRFKNVDGLLHAFAYLGMPQACLLIAGDGDLRPSLEALSARLGLESRIRFLGKRTPGELPPIYSAADVTVLPSTGVESFGLVLLESLSCATPVIASRLPGVRAAVDEGVDGYLVPPGDTRALADALRHVLSHREESARMGQRGRHKAEGHYTWESSAQRLEQVYADVLAEAEWWRARVAGEAA